MLLVFFGELSNKRTIRTVSYFNHYDFAVVQNTGGDAEFSKGGRDGARAQVCSGSGGRAAAAAVIPAAAIVSVAAAIFNVSVAVNRKRPCRLCQSSAVSPRTNSKSGRIRRRASG